MERKCGILDWILDLVWAVLTKSHRLAGLNNTHLFLTDLEAGNSRSSLWQNWCLVRAHFLVHRLHLAMSLHYEGREGALWGPFMRTLIPFMRAPPS